MTNCFGKDFALILVVISLNSPTCRFFLIFFYFALYAGSAEASVLCSQAHLNRYALEYLPRDLEKEILGLSDHQEIPEQIYQRFSINEIAKAIVQRIRAQEIQYQEELNKVGKHKTVNLLEEADIILFFKSEDFESIGEKGFLNQYEIKKSSGNYSPERRPRAEDAFTGIRLGLGTKAMSLRPKSAFLNIRTDVELARKWNDVSETYGTIGAVMNPDVKQRALWTAQDSFELASGYGIIVNFTDAGKNLAPHRGTFYRNSLPSHIAPIKPNYDGIVSKYYETLIYGQIGLADVQYFITTHRADVEILRAIGKPVYLAQAVTKHNRIIYEKTELLFEGH